MNDVIEINNIFLRKLSAHLWGEFPKLLFSKASTAFHTEIIP